jgi:hypothetical protein
VIEITAKECRGVSRPSQESCDRSPSARLESSRLPAPIDRVQLATDAKVVNSKTDKINTFVRAVRPRRAGRDHYRASAGHLPAEHQRGFLCSAAERGRRIRGNDKVGERIEPTHAAAPVCGTLPFSAP